MKTVELVLHNISAALVRIYKLWNTEYRLYNFRNPAYELSALISAFKLTLCNMKMNDNSHIIIHNSILSFLD